MGARPPVFPPPPGTHGPGPGPGPDAAGPGDDPLAPVHGYPGGPQAPVFLDVDAAQAAAALEPPPALEPPARFDRPLIVAGALLVVAALCFVAGAKVAASAPQPPPAACAPAFSTDAAALAGTAPARVPDSAASGVVGPARWQLDRADRSLDVVAATAESVVVGNWFDGRSPDVPATLSAYAPADGSLRWSARLATAGGGAPDLVVDDGTGFLLFRADGQYRVVGFDLTDATIVSCVTVADAPTPYPVPAWSVAGGQVFSVEAGGRFVAHGAGSTVAWSSRAGVSRALGMAGGTVVLLRPLSNTPAALVGVDPATGAERWTVPLGTGAPAGTADPDPAVTSPLGVLAAAATDARLTVAYDPSAGSNVAASRPIQIITVAASGRAGAPQWVDAGAVALTADATDVYAALTTGTTQSWQRVTPGRLVPVPGAGELALLPGVTLAPGTPPGSADAGLLAAAAGPGPKSPLGSIEVFTPAGRVGRIVAATGSRPTVAATTLLARTGADAGRAPLTAWELER